MSLTNCVFYVCPIDLTSAYLRVRRVRSQSEVSTLVGYLKCNSGRHTLRTAAGFQFLIVADFLQQYTSND